MKENMSIKEDLIKKLKSKEAKVGILGLGYVGLPLAVVFAEGGFHVTGIDPDSRKVDSLNKGISYIPDVKTESIEKLVKSGTANAGMVAKLNACQMALQGGAKSVVIVDGRAPGRVVKALAGEKTSATTKVVN